MTINDEQVLVIINVTISSIILVLLIIMCYIVYTKITKWGQAINQIDIQAISNLFDISQRSPNSIPSINLGHQTTPFRQLNA